VFASERILGAFEVAIVIDLKKMADLWLVATDPRRGNLGSDPEALC
jgi:hypothetical protein